MNDRDRERIRIGAEYDRAIEEFIDGLISIDHSYIIEQVNKAIELLKEANIPIATTLLILGSKHAYDLMLRKLEMS